VAEHFELLAAPAKILSFEDFWQRYTYRCNVNRVMKELGDADAAAMHQSVTDSMERMKGMFQSVVNSAVLNPTTTTKNVAETSTTVEASSQPSNKEETKIKSFGPQTSATKNVAETSTTVEASSQPSNKEEKKIKSFGPQTSAGTRIIQLNTYKISKPSSFGPQNSAATRLIQLNTYKLVSKSS
jgi:hypothetical protein